MNLSQQCYWRKDQSTNCIYLTSPYHDWLVKTVSQKYEVEFAVYFHDMNVEIKLMSKLFNKQKELEQVSGMLFLFKMLFK